MNNAERCKQWREANPELKQEINQRWREKNKLRVKWQSQKSVAKSRGIEWNFSFEEWVDWWGDDIDKRGTSLDSLCMCRYNDEGPYSPDNVYKSTKRKNLEEVNYGWTN